MIIFSLCRYGKNSLWFEDGCSGEVYDFTDDDWIIGSIWHVPGSIWPELYYTDDHPRGEFCSSRQPGGFYATGEPSEFENCYTEMER